MEYKLLDTGGEQKLEQFGGITLVRPCAQAVWRPSLSPAAWEKANAVFTREPTSRWIGKVPPSWTTSHAGITFKLAPTDFGHVGMFPEHSLLWSWMQDCLSPGAQLLNLFAYTGGATFAAARQGAAVCHVDASKAAVAWARENSQLNGLEKAPIRWIVDDVLQFLKREVRRGRLYTGIILDPPTFGRGSRGEVFKIEKDLPEILRLAFSLLVKGPAFLILSSHTPGYTPLVLKHLLSQEVSHGTIEAGELVVPGPLPLPAGTYARWFS